MSIKGIRKFPLSIVEKVRKVVYQFIWDDRKGLSWAEMVLPRIEGGALSKEPAYYDKSIGH